MVGKALALLTELGEHPHGAAASELSRRLGFPLSTAHRLLGALVRDGYAGFDESTKRYTVGLRVFSLAQGILRTHGLTALARPILEQVSMTTREATLLAVRDGNRQLYMVSMSGPQQVQVVGEPGKHGPLHVTSQGKVLIGFAPDAARERLLKEMPLTRFGPKSITNRRKFRQEIERVRSLGYAVADEEHEEGIRAISVPVFDSDVGVAALSAAAPAYRRTVAELVAMLPTLRDAADSLSALVSLHQETRPNTR